MLLCLLYVKVDDGFYMCVWGLYPRQDEPVEADSAAGDQTPGARGLPV